MKPIDRNRKIADAKAQAVWVPSRSSRARRYMRHHHVRTDSVRKRPANCHQPPSLNGAMRIPYSGFGGSSASQGSWRRNWIGLQWTEANMFRPMISKAMKPKISDTTPRLPR